MRKFYLLFLILCFFTVTGCSSEEKMVQHNMNELTKNGPAESSNPYDYIEQNQEAFNELLEHPKITFEYAFTELIASDGSNGIVSYIEAVLCSKINPAFQYDFSDAHDFITKYREYLMNLEGDMNEYDAYAVSLIK